jgi:alpha 1,3-glucosidase
VFVCDLVRVRSRVISSGLRTGDNKADWAHLRASVPMLLSLATAGVPFAGADVGGFFGVTLAIRDLVLMARVCVRLGNPDGELMTRWYQVAAFQPVRSVHHV